MERIAIIAVYFKTEKAAINYAKRKKKLWIVIGVEDGYVTFPARAIWPEKQ